MAAARPLPILIIVLTTDSFRPKYLQVHFIYISFERHLTIARHPSLSNIFNIYLVLILTVFYILLIYSKISYGYHFLLIKSVASQKHLLEPKRLLIF